MDPASVLGVPKGATPAAIRKAYLRLALKTHPDKGGDVEAFRQLQEAYEALRDGGSEAKASSPAVSPRSPRGRRPPPKAQTKRPFRCASCGRRFATREHLRVHAATHARDDDHADDGPKQTARQRAEARRRSEAQARGGATRGEDEARAPAPTRVRSCARCGAKDAYFRESDACRVCGAPRDGAPRDEAPRSPSFSTRPFDDEAAAPPRDRAEIRSRAAKARQREAARAAAAQTQQRERDGRQAAQLQEHLMVEDHAARENAMVVEAVRQSSEYTAREEARRAEERAQLQAVLDQTAAEEAVRSWEEADLSQALAQSHVAERERKEAEELERALRLSRVAERERKEQMELEAALALSLAGGDAVAPPPDPLELSVARSAPVFADPLEPRGGRPGDALDAALASPRAAFLAQRRDGARSDFGAWQRQVEMLRDLGFAASVAAAYADARRDVEDVVDRMLEDGVDFAEEPVYAGRERSSVVKRVKDSILGAVRSVLPSSSPAPVVAVPVDAENEGDDWMPLVDGAQTYWMHASLELCAWSDPRADADAVLFDSQAM